MIGLNTAVYSAPRINWTLTSNFGVDLTPVSTDLQTLIGWNAGDVEYSKIFQLSIKSIDLPQHTADLVEKMTAGDWHFSRNEDEAYVTTVTFRDMWGGSLYRLFKNIWRISKVNYPDDTAFHIVVKLTHGPNFGMMTCFEASKAYLTSISQIQLSHDNSEILEFSVEFKSNEPLAEYTQTLSNITGSQTDISSLTTQSSVKSNKYTSALQNASKAITDKFSSLAKSASSSVLKSAVSNVKGLLNWD